MYNGNAFSIISNGRYSYTNMYILIKKIAKKL